MLVLTILSHAFTGPLTPAVAEVAAGYRSARLGAKPESVIGKNRVAVGKWFDGTKQVPTEYVVWISPGLVARWLGYLARRERWPRGEVQRRWDTYRLATQGRPFFFVALSAYPRQSFVDLTPVAPAKLDTLTLDDVAIETKDRTMSGELHLVGQWRARERAIIERFTWWQVPEWAEWAAPKTLTGGDAPRYELGEWYGAWYTVRGQSSMRDAPKISLQSFEKVRTAQFSGAIR